MCLLILMTLVTWYVFRPEVIDATNFSTFYGAGNCKCAEVRNCPHWCESGQYIVTCHPHPETESCEEDDENHPCGTDGECSSFTGGTYDCTIIVIAG